MLLLLHARSNTSVADGEADDLKAFCMQDPSCEQAFKDAGWKIEDIDDVILVGGQTRMPLVQERVAAFFGKKPSRSVNPDEVVAVGAALQAAVLSGGMQDVLLLDVTPLSLGVETAGGVFTRIIPRNTTIPVRRSQVFSTAVDNQPYVNIHVLQGERDMTADNKSLAHFQLTGIPPAPRGAPQIEVSFDIDANGIVGVSAKDLGTGREQRVEVRPTSGLTQDEIDRFIAEAEEHRLEDRHKLEWSDLRNRAEMLFYATEAALKEFGIKVEPAARQKMTHAIADCRRLLETATDLPAALRSFEELETGGSETVRIGAGGRLVQGVRGRDGSLAMAQAGDHYGVLGVDRSASTSEIKAAYRRLALKWHPDRNPGDRRAEERFKEVSMAYAVLGDEDKRARYDRFGQASDVAFGVGGDFDSATDFFDAIFGDLFGLGRKKAAGQDLRYTLELDFQEAAMGCEKNIRFTRQEDCGGCSGTGAESGAAGLISCNKCAGKGFTRQRTGFFSARHECLACGGSGEIPRVRCRTCGGVGLVEREKDYLVRVPAGFGGGQRPAGGGGGFTRPARWRGGGSFVNVRVRSHAFYREEAGVLVCELPISPSEASLGAEVDVQLLDNSVKMKVPAGTQSGAVFRLRGKGMPRAGGVPRGDAHVRVIVETPADLNDEARSLLSKLEAALSPAALPRRQAFRRMGTPDAPAASATSPAAGKGRR